jgi:hypothetical protein
MPTEAMNKKRSSYLINVNARVQVVEILNLQATRKLMDTDLLQLLDGQWASHVREKHVGLGKDVVEVICPR